MMHVTLFGLNSHCGRRQHIHGIKLEELKLSFIIRQPFLENVNINRISFCDLTINIQTCFLWVRIFCQIISILQYHRYCLKKSLQFP